MRWYVALLFILSLAVAGCATHETPRCSGRLERINPPEQVVAAPDAHGR